MGKRRNTAKTGDTKIYQGRGSDRKEKEIPQHDDLEVDEGLGADDGEQDFHDPGIELPSHTLDLGDGDADSTTSEEMSEASALMAQEDESSASESSDDEDEEDLDLRTWGKTKSTLYGGDTADIELTEDKSDAFVEETAAREIQSSRFSEMDDADFEVMDYDNEDTEEKKETSGPRRNLDDRMRTVGKMHQDILSLLKHLAGVLDGLQSSTIPAKTTLCSMAESSDSVGTTKHGLQYLLTKSLVELSTALNASLCILVQSTNQTNIGNDDHPVVVALKNCLTLMNNLDTHVTSKSEGILGQIRDVARAGDLLLSEPVDDEAKVDSDESEPNADSEVEDAELPTEGETQEEPTVQKPRDYGTSNDARFGLRQNELYRKSGQQASGKKYSEFGDMDIDDNAVRALARTVNSIEQRSKSKKSTIASAESNPDFNEANSDHFDEDQMLEEMGGFADLEDKEEKKGRSSAGKSDSGFYETMEQKKKAQKSMRKTLYQVPDKFPAREEEVEGERGITRVIMKNRGLVAHKAKINRNPRVKKREQYRKAVIRRKGATRTMREEAERDKYDGESTGIKSRVSHSRKLIS